MRRGVALLVTIILVMLMSIVIGWSMQTLGDAKESVEKERLMIQSALLVEDLLGILKNSPEINAVAEANNSIAFYTLLVSTSMLPFESEGYRVLVSLKSARDRLNINTFAKANTQRAKQRRIRLANFLAAHGYGGELYNYILDAMGGIKEDGSYRSDLFYNDPTLYRNAIVSSRQMKRILSDFAKREGSDPFSKLNFDKIFAYNEDPTTRLDLNFATPEVWEFVAGVSKERARQLFENAGAYQSVDDLELGEGEKKILSLFDYSFFEPVILVHMDIFQEENSAMIEFEYDIKKKRAKRFVFEIQK